MEFYYKDIFDEYLTKKFMLKEFRGQRRDNENNRSFDVMNSLRRH